MAFYDIFESLCTENGVTPTQVARDIGIKQSVVAMWKKRGSTPKAETVQKLADYFDVSVDYLLGLRPLPDDIAEVFLSRDVGPNIADLRKAKGLTQKDLSEKTGIPLRSIQALERGTGGHFLSDDELWRLAEEFRIKRDQIKGLSVTQEWMADTHSKNCWQRLNDAWRKLNVLGHDKLVERAEELVEITRYQAQQSTQPPPVDSTGQDTPAPAGSAEDYHEDEWDRGGGDRYGGRRDE